MSNVNLIQSKILQLEGGAFQSLFDEYLYKRYRFKNIQTLGVQTGTNKPTKGTPDSYVLTDDGKYILINYGSVSSQPAEKIKADILSCFDTSKLILDKAKIKKIICGHRSTNIHVEQFDSIRESIEGVEIELIGIDTLSHDLALNYPHIAKEHLGIEIDTNQFFDIEDFVKAYDANGTNAPIDCDFLYRKNELDLTCKSINNNAVTVLTGPSGIGKTRLALEACRKQENERLKVYCVHSNGNLLYEDIKYYVDNPGKYLIFLDDANMIASLDNVLHTLLTSSDEYDVRVLITVRDYAKNGVITAISNYTKPEEIQIDRLKNEEIKDILKQDLGILNPDYLDKISEIANGNARLAYLAGIRSIDGGYQTLRSAEDIFKNYYGHVIDDAKLNKDDVMILFIITVAGLVRKDRNQLYSNLKSRYCPEIDESETIEKLYKLELVDCFEAEITKISDQSFGNFILYYVLYEKHWVSIESIIAIAFPKYRNKVVYVLNTIIEIFNSSDVVKFVEDSIIAAWNNAPKGQEMDYLESFYQVDADKALDIIKKHIEQETNVEFDLHGFDIDAKKNYHNIATKEIEILGGYKYTEYFEDAIDLIMLYFKKRPDLIMDFYFVISGSLLYDKYSWKNKFSNEKDLMDKLWGATQEGSNYNNSILYIHIAEYALSTDFSYTEKGNNKSINFVTMKINFTKEIASLRSKIWIALGSLRRNVEYRDEVNKVLSEVHLSGLDEENSKLYLQSDFDNIYVNVITKGNINFSDAIIVGKYKENAERLRMPIDERYLISENNHDYKIYKVLSQEHFLGEIPEDDMKIRRKSIAEEIDKYTLNDYRKLFKTCRLLEKNVSEREHYSLSTGLDIVFEILEDDVDLYVKVITEYFNEDAPFMPNSYPQVKYLLAHLGYEKTFVLIRNQTFQKRDGWLSVIWECIDEGDINDKIVKDYSLFIKQNLNKENPIIPSAKMLKLYGDRDIELKGKVIKTIIEKPKLSASFLGNTYRDENIEVLLSVFKDDYDEISQIYINAIKSNNLVDYGGKLFIKIFEQRSEIWKEYIDWVKSNIYRDGYEQIIELVWKTQKWKECIDYAFDILIKDDKAFLSEQPSKLLFSKTKDENLNMRKKQWLLDNLHKSHNDIDRCAIIIYVVINAMPDWKLDFILEFLKVNKNIEDFKRIQLFPMSSSWSGSEIPLIIDKIRFVETLKKLLKGVDYIEHRRHLEEVRRGLESYRKHVEIEEYIENADYA